MSAFNPERLNINDLTIEEPEEKGELPFNPETYITKEDWESMMEQMEESRDDLFSFVGKAAAIKILNPEVNIKITDKEREDIKELLEVWKKRNWYGFFQFAMSCRILDPKMDIPTSGYHNEIRQAFQEKLKNQMSHYIGMAARAKVVEPARVGRTSTEEMWPEVMKYFETHRKDIQHFTEKATEIKILKPEENLDLTEEVWDKMLNKLDSLRGEDMTQFSQYAMDLKILAAQEVKVPEGGGLEVKMRREQEASEPEIPLIPEKKSF